MVLSASANKVTSSNSVTSTNDCHTINVCNISVLETKNSADGILSKNNKDILGLFLDKYGDGRDIDYHITSFFKELKNRKIATLGDDFLKIFLFKNDEKEYFSEDIIEFFKDVDHYKLVYFIQNHGVEITAELIKKSVIDFQKHLDRVSYNDIDIIFSHKDKKILLTEIRTFPSDQVFEYFFRKCLTYKDY